MKRNRKILAVFLFVLVFYLLSLGYSWLNEFEKDSISTKCLSIGNVFVFAYFWAHWAGSLAAVAMEGKTSKHGWIEMALLILVQMIGILLIGEEEVSIDLAI